MTNGNATGSFFYPFASLSSANNVAEFCARNNLNRSLDEKTNYFDYTGNYDLSNEMYSLECKIVEMEQLTQHVR